MSVYSKLYSYVNSPAGQAKIQSTLQGYIAEGRATTPSGQKLVNADVAYDLAQKLIGCIMARIPSSISSSISGMSCDGPKLVNGGKSFQCDLSFIGDLSRMSLRPDIYGGIDNIVALFNNGYEAGGIVRGFWHEKRVKSVPSRSPMQFMQDAVGDFNSTYGKRYNVQVTLSGNYD